MSSTRNLCSFKPFQYPKLYIQDKQPRLRKIFHVDICFLEGEVEGDIFNLKNKSQCQRIHFQVSLFSIDFLVAIVLEIHTFMIASLGCVSLGKSDI